MRGGRSGLPAVVEPVAHYVNQVGYLHSVLMHTVPFSDSYRVVVQRVKVHCNAVRSAYLILSAVAPSNTLSIVILC